MSSYSADAAEQVVRMTLEGSEVAIKLAGSGAKQLAILLYAILRDQKKTKGKTRLTNMLRSGKELKVFAIKDEDLTKFCGEAKRYGVLYTVLKDLDADDGITDIMVRAEDASKINRIFERYKFATVDMASIKTEIEKKREEKAADGKTDPVMLKDEKTEAFLDALFKPKEEAENTEPDPDKARTTASRQSGHSLESSSQSQRNPRDLDSSSESRPSVKKELAEIREELAKKQSKTNQRANEHNHPKKKKKNKTKKGR